MRKQKMQNRVGRQRLRRRLRPDVRQKQMPSPNRYPPDDWTIEGSRITDPDKVEAIRSELETKGPVIVKHWHYRGACGPSHFVFEDIDDYLTYMNTHAQPGDAFDVWGLYGLLSGVGSLAEGKFPDDDGTVPKKGAY